MKFNKYKAKPTFVDNIRFPSKLEARKYEQLKMLRESGQIKYFLRQVPFDIPKAKYFCDFMVVHSDDRIEYIDSKGVETPVFKLKKKQVEALYPVKINVVKK